MNVHGRLDTVAQQVAAYEATKGTVVVVSGDVGQTRELRVCLDNTLAELTTLAQYVVSHHATESRFIPQITSLMDRCEILKTMRYQEAQSPEAQLEELATRIGAEITPAKSADGR